jgi:hypothetical protein
MKQGILERTNPSSLLILMHKLNNLQNYITQNYRIIYRVVQRLSQLNLKISHYRHI